MKVNTQQKIKTGAFVLAGLGVLFLFIILIGNQKNLFRHTVNLQSNFRNVAGLEEGCFVRFAGIKIGTVDVIEIINDTTIKVEISIRENIRKFIKTDSRASIVGDGLMGDKLLQLSPGSADAPVITENAVLVGVNPFDIEKMMAKVEKVGEKVGRIVNNIDTLSGHLTSIFAKVSEGKGTLGKLINSEKMSDDLEKTINSASRTVKTVDSAAAGLKDNMEAAKHNIIFKGYFKKKEKKRIKDSIENSKTILKSIAKDSL